MKFNDDTIARLAARLTTNDDAPLTEDERSLLAAALLELSASQSVMARQARLLQLHGELRSRLSAMAQAALGDLRSRLDQPQTIAEYDFEAAEAARRELLAEMESANTTRAAIAASLQFIRRLAGAAP